MKPKTKIIAWIAGEAAAVALLVILAASASAEQPQVNNPPEIQEFSISFGVKAGNLIGIDTDDPRACTRVQVNFSVTVKDHEGDLVTVSMDLDGDKKLDDAKQKIKGEGTAMGKKIYKDVGPMQVRYRACDKKGLCSQILRAEFNVVLCPPELNKIRTDVQDGDLDKIGIMTLTSRDKQDDKVFYEVDWDDDGVFETKTKLVPPDKPVTLKHTFPDRFMHIVSLRVCDTKDGCSETETRKF
ncbi:MAG: hypothetical protein JRG91_08265 [Deltaproteobacteria bacterium]|nr:hypothetical protein [Deltaproteobacteria bacterium]